MYNKLIGYILKTIYNYIIVCYITALPFILLKVLLSAMTDCFSHKSGHGTHIYREVFKIQLLECL